MPISRPQRPFLLRLIKRHIITGCKQAADVEPADAHKHVGELLFCPAARLRTTSRNTSADRDRSSHRTDHMMEEEEEEEEFSVPELMLAATRAKC